MANKTNSSKTFPIIFSVVVVAMIAIVVVSVMSDKSGKKVNSQQEFSPSASVSAATVDGTIGESSLSAFNDPSTDDAIGKIVPQISTQNFKGEDVVITPGEKPYAIAFLAHWCPVCQAEVPKIVSLYKDGELPEDVEIYAIATGTNETRANYPPSQWLFDEEWPWTQAADDTNSTIASAFGLTGYPYLVFVNADGTVSQRISGEQEEATLIAAANAISKSATK